MGGSKQRRERMQRTGTKAKTLTYKAANKERREERVSNRLMGAAEEEKE